MGVMFCFYALKLPNYPKIDKTGRVYHFHCPVRLLYPPWLRKFLNSEGQVGHITDENRSLSDKTRSPSGTLSLDILVRMNYRHHACFLY